MQDSLSYISPGIVGSEVVSVEGIIGVDTMLNPTSVSRDYHTTTDKVLNQLVDGSRDGAERVEGGVSVVQMPVHPQSPLGNKFAGRGVQQRRNYREHVSDGLSGSDGKHPHIKTKKISLSPNRQQNNHQSPPKALKQGGKPREKSMSPVPQPSPHRRNHRHKPQNKPALMTVVVRRVDLLDGAAAAAAAAAAAEAEAMEELYQPQLVLHDLQDNVPLVPYFPAWKGTGLEPRSPSPSLSSGSSGAEGCNTLSTSPRSLQTLEMQLSLSPARGNYGKRGNTTPVSPYKFEDPFPFTAKDIATVAPLVFLSESDGTDTDRETISSSEDTLKVTHGENKGSECGGRKWRPNDVAVVRVNNKGHKKIKPNFSSRYNHTDDSPNPHPSSVVHDKYWAQRHRLFSYFDEGVMLDSEGWYSVTPEVIADHVARTVGEMSTTMMKLSNPYEGIVILDAFCGCGGNSIAFGKLPLSQVSLVVCVDIDRNKLRMAAHNASIYGIPTDKLVFVEANTVFVMDQCYREGELVYTGAYELYCMPREQCAGYTIGGLDLLPFHIDAVFMDPPWGGIDYGAAGKNGYDLAKNMKIQYYGYQGQNEYGEELQATVDGIGLLKIAAAATKTKLVVYDLPRNTNKTSLGRAALEAGYRGNLKLEEHYLNGRLKTVTSYFGRDFSGLLNTA